jgi:Cof subfamily protein (haloacid dehalogenase superfamily)
MLNPILDPAEIDLKIQLVVTDLDGTFLNSDGLPSSGALQSVKKIHESGIGFTLCSGRADPGTWPFVELLKVKLPYIVSGGTAIIDPVDHKTLYESPLSRDQVNILIDLGLRSGCNMVFHTPQSIFAFCKDEFWENVCVERWINKGGWKNVYRSDSPSELQNESIIHINFFDKDEILPQLAKEVESLPENLQACIVFSKLEITDRKASKGIALQHLAENLKIPLENILSIGDGMNDISMLAVSGTGIAVKNSPPELLQEADYLAPGNDEGGFAFTIDHLLSYSLESLQKIS